MLEVQGGPWSGLGGPDLLEDHWGVLSCLSDDAVTPLLNFVMGSGMEDVRTPSWAEARAGEASFTQPWAPNPSPGHAKLGGGGPSPEHNTLKALLEQKSRPREEPRGLR